MIEHAWDISPAEAVALQKELASLVRARQMGGPVRLVAGTDCAFIEGGSRVVAAAVLCDARTMAVVETATATARCEMPYIPGLLSFREAPAVLAAVRKLARPADLLLCDGQGIAHPRGIGLASHVGLLAEMPTVGVAKSRLCGEHRAPGPRRGCRTQLRLGGSVVGAVVRTRTAVRPLFVSVGHLVTLEQAVRWTLRCCRGFRLPEPNRLAHHAVTRISKSRA
jgi:deoxyribonuclease V